MNDFRKKQIRPARQKAVDGILGTPSRQQLDVRSLSRRPASGDNFRSNARHVDNFKRPEGYYPATRSSVALQPSNETKTAKPLSGQNNSEPTSLLHMTLPGAKESDTNRRKRDRSKNSRHRSSLKKWSLRSAVALVTLFVLVGGFLFTKGYFKLHKVFKGGGLAAALQDNVDPSRLKGEGDGRINVLLLGKGGPGHEGPDLTDTLLLASIDPINKTASLVSVPRDLWVSVPGFGSMKINAVYANGKYRALNAKPKDVAGAEKSGVNLAEQTIQKVLGVPIHYYGVVDFKAFQQAVDTVGGVTINVPNDLVDYTMAWTNKGNPVLARKGVQAFDGNHALMYVRSRHGSARGDFDRTERQRLFIVALSQKVLSAGTYTNPVKVSQLMSAFGDHVETDLSINDAIALMKIGKKINSNNIGSVGLADPPNNFVTTDMIARQSVVVPRAGVGNYAEINSYVRSRLKDGYIAKENAHISVLNGSNTPGLAAQKADALKTYGYNIGLVGDAPSHDFQKTVIVDLTKGKNKYTQNYLERRFNTKAVRKLPSNTIKPGNASFVIILGQNETFDR